MGRKGSGSESRSVKETVPVPFPEFVARLALLLCVLCCAGLSPAARSPSLRPCSSLGFCTRGPGLVLGLTSQGQRGSAQPIGSSWSSGPSPGPAPSQRWLCTRPQTPSRWRGFHSACPLPLCHLNVTWCFSLICSVWGSCGGTCLLEKVSFEVASPFSSGKPPGP